MYILDVQNDQRADIGTTFEKKESSTPLRDTTRARPWLFPAETVRTRKRRRAGIAGGFDGRARRYGQVSTERRDGKGQV